MSTNVPSCVTFHKRQTAGERMYRLICAETRTPRHAEPWSGFSRDWALADFTAPSSTVGEIVQRRSSAGNMQSFGEWEAVWLVG